MGGQGPERKRETWEPGWGVGSRSAAIGHRFWHSTPQPSLGLLGNKKGSTFSAVPPRPSAEGRGLEERGRHGDGPGHCPGGATTREPRGQTARAQGAGRSERRQGGPASAWPGMGPRRRAAERGGRGGLGSHQAASQGPGRGAGPKPPAGSARGRGRLLTRADRPQSARGFWAPPDRRGSRNHLRCRTWPRRAPRPCWGTKDEGDGGGSGQGGGGGQGPDSLREPEGGGESLQEAARARKQAGPRGAGPRRGGAERGTLLPHAPG